MATFPQSLIDDLHQSFVPYSVLQPIAMPDHEYASWYHRMLGSFALALGEEAHVVAAYLSADLASGTARFTLLDDELVVVADVNGIDTDAAAEVAMVTAVVRVWPRSKLAGLTVSAGRSVAQGSWPGTFSVVATYDGVADTIEISGRGQDTHVRGFADALRADLRRATA